MGKLGWFNRTLRNYRRVDFTVEKQYYNHIDRLQHSINFHRSREEDGEVTYEEINIDSIAGLFIVNGIEQALSKGFNPFAKVFYQYFQAQSFVKISSYKRISAFLHASEIKVLDDLTAMINEYFDDEYREHNQQLFEIERNDLIRFFIQNGCEHFNRVPISKASNLLESRLV